MPSGPGMDAPPPPSPDVTNQMGGQLAPIAAQIAARARAAQGGGGGAPGGGGVTPPPMDATNAAHPQGALIAQSVAVQKVLETMGRMSGKFAPYAARMVELMKEGIGEVTGENSGGASGSSDTGPASAKPPQDGGQPSAGGVSFPG
jgi:hypothetical protein